MTAWSEWTVQATSQKEAVRKVMDGEVEDEGYSDNDGPNGKYEVERVP